MPAVALLLCLAATVEVRSDDGSGFAAGKKIYAQHCAKCHGDRGQGSSEYDAPLFGDLSVEQLSKYIDETMPEDDPERCVGEAAEQVARYIHQQFYSAAAQNRFRAPRVELSRLTVRQYQESVADLVNSFEKPIWISAERGLEANYFAARHWTDKRRLSKQTDPCIDFLDGVPHFDPTGKYEDIEKQEKQGNKMNEGFSVYWKGALIAPETGEYRIKVQSKNGFQLWLNNPVQPLIDREVRSDDVVDHEAAIFLLAGRPYPLVLQLFSYPDPPAKIRLMWKPPNGIESVIPQSVLMPHSAPESLCISTKFPADDASDGYLRGVSVSQQWDESTTEAAIEAANWIAERIWKLAGTRSTAEDRGEKVKSFCRQFVERAFASRLTEQEADFFVEQHFDQDVPIKDQLKRVVILTLKSPRFLYPALETRETDFEIARQLALVLWDSIPDEQLFQLAAAGKLGERSTVEAEIQRMVADPRAKSKLRAFFHFWLKTDEASEATKDKELFPDFDEQLVYDLKQSLDLYLDEVAWNESSDFRQLFLADYLFVNDRLAEFYDLDSPATDFSRVAVDPDQRAGILTHPFLMAGLAYHKNSSPIHRGVFVARNLLGRTLRQPPTNVKPLTEEFNPKMTTRERVEHQTGDTACMSCHSLINPLGFSLENFDAVGRFRTKEKEQPIDVTGVYETPTGESVPLAGPRDLANFLANNEMAQKSFVSQLFQHYAKQSIYAYGETRLDELHAHFVDGQYSIRHLLFEIAIASCLAGVDDHLQSQPAKIERTPESGN